MELSTNRQDKDIFQARLAARGPTGQPLSLVTGQEPVDELRRLIIRFSQSCPANGSHRGCPFQIMNSLSHTSLTTLVNSLSRRACLELFEMEQACRYQSAATGSLKQQ